MHTLVHGDTSCWRRKPRSQDVDFARLGPAMHGWLNTSSTEPLSGGRLGFVLVLIHHFLGKLRQRRRLKANSTGACLLWILITSLGASSRILQKSDNLEKKIVLEIDELDTRSPPLLFTAPTHDYTIQRFSDRRSFSSGATAHSGVHPLLKAATSTNDIERRNCDL